MKNVYYKEFDSKGYRGGAIPKEVHIEVAKVLHRWMKKEGMKPSNKDMQVYLQCGAWLKGD